MHCCHNEYRKHYVYEYTFCKGYHAEKPFGLYLASVYTFQKAVHYDRQVAEYQLRSSVTRTVGDSIVPFVVLMYHVHHGDVSAHLLQNA